MMLRMLFCFTSLCLVPILSSNAPAKGPETPLGMTQIHTSTAQHLISTRIKSQTGWQRVSVSMGSPQVVKAYKKPYVVRSFTVTPLDRGASALNVAAVRGTILVSKKPVYPYEGRTGSRRIIDYKEPWYFNRVR